MNILVKEKRKTDFFAFSTPYKTNMQDYVKVLSFKLGSVD